MENKELFEDYEITGWQVSSKTYKFIGTAAVLQLLAIFTLGQFNLLQTKACDSPYVGKVCQVLDAAYLGSVMLGEDTGFSDREYNKTVFDDTDITFIDVSSAEPPLEYPDGYFALVNENQMSETQPMSNDFQFPTLNSNSPAPSLDMNQPQVLPTPNDKATNQPNLDSPFGFSDDSKPITPPKAPRVTPYRPPYRPPVRTAPKTSGSAKLSNSSPSKLPPLGDGDNKTTAKNPKDATTDTKDSTVAKKDPTPDDKGEVDPATGFNQKPLKDFGKEHGEEILNKKINLDAPFMIEVTAQINELGKLVNPKVVATKESDPQMSKLAREAVFAFGDSQLLKPLYDMGVQNVTITFVQNQDNLQAIIKTETPSQSRANLMVTLLNNYLAKFFKPKEGSDEQILMKKAQFVSQDKFFIINFLISNEEKNQMIEKSLKNLKQQLEQNNDAGNQAATTKS